MDATLRWSPYVTNKGNASVLTLTPNLEFFGYRGPTETLLILRQIFQFCASRPSAPTARKLLYGRLTSSRDSRAEGDHKARALPVAPLPVGSARARGTSPAQGKAFGALDVMDER